LNGVLDSQFRLTFSIGLSAITVTRFEDTLRDHPVRTSLQGLKQDLSVLPADVVEADGWKGAVDRAGRVADYVLGLLHAADPELVARATLDAIQANVDTARNAVSQLPVEPGAAGQLDTSMDGALTQVPPLAMATGLPPDEAKRVRKQLGAALTSKVASIEERAGRVEAAILDAETRHGSAAAEVSQADEHRRAA
jgi:hypothetical protein